MKQLITFLMLTLLGLQGFAQTPNAIPYQAVARNSSGNLLVNQNVRVRFSIHNETASGIIVYQENQSVTTNNLGLFTVNIGQGTATTGTFASINWGTGLKFIQVEIDVNGGSNYVDMGTQQMMSVPYALYAANANVPGVAGPQGPQGEQGPAGEQGPQGEQGPAGSVSPGTATGEMLHWNGTDWVAIPLGTNGQRLTLVNGLPVWQTAPEGSINITSTISLSTAEASNIRYNSATFGGTITGSATTVLGRGVCVSTSPNPSVANAVITNDVGIGTFSSNFSALLAASTYYIRSFAINKAGIAYGNEISFTTLTPTLPTVSTTSTSNISVSTAIIGGNISDDGGTPVNVRGVCWSTSPNPTIENSFTSNGAGIGAFSSNLLGLTDATTYYVRAYATNSLGTGYGGEINFTTSTPTLPTVNTTAISNTSGSTATCGGNINNDGNVPVTTRGVCWSTSPNPTIANSVSASGSGIGAFTSSLEGLALNTNYYVRAYAITNYGIAYGNDISIKTWPVNIGGSYQGGKLAYVFQPGEPGYIAGQVHGLIAATSDFYAPWGCSGVTISGADGTALGTGRQNTIDIMAGCQEAQIAARLCGNLLLGGYDDWFLPSKDELYKLLINGTAIGLNALHYTSSTEYISTYNFYYTFFNFWQSSVIPKSTPENVRAVRAF